MFQTPERPPDTSGGSWCWVSRALVTPSPASPVRARVHPHVYSHAHVHAHPQLCPCPSPCPSSCPCPSPCPSPSPSPRPALLTQLPPCCSQALPAPALSKPSFHFQLPNEQSPAQQFHPPRVWMAVEVSGDANKNSLSPCPSQAAPPAKPTVPVPAQRCQPSPEVPAQPPEGLHQGTANPPLTPTTASCCCVHLGTRSAEIPAPAVLGFLQKNLRGELQTHHCEAPKLQKVFKNILFSPQIRAAILAISAISKPVFYSKESSVCVVRKNKFLFFH